MITSALFGELKNGTPNISKAYYTHLISCDVSPTDAITYPPQICADKNDFLLLCGGDDIDPLLYGQKAYKTSRFKRWFDELEFSYIKAFLNLNKPILGICRGMQSLNVFLGGDLYQDIPSIFGYTHFKSTPHEIIIMENSLLSYSIGKRAIVNSRHHQSVKTLGDTLYIAAKTHDEIIEAIESITYPILGVQWHPERINGNTVFEHFIKYYVKNKKFPYKETL